MTRVRRPVRKKPTSARPDSRPRQTARTQRLHEWLSAHRLLVVLAISIASVALRAIYFVQLDSGPCASVHRLDGTDMQYFDGWGRAIAGGDWLSASVGVPMHPWHREVAARYFAAHPEVRADFERQASRAGGGRTPEGMLWARWTGGHQFYQDPLHAYLVGLTYLVTGADPLHVFIWQMLLGVLSNVLIYILAREYFGDLVGTVAAVLAVLCGPLLYYEGVLLRDSTITCAALGLVWLTHRALSRDRWPWFVALGASLGLAVMLKSTFLLFAIVLTGGIILHVRRQVRHAVVTVAAVVAGFVLAVAPLAVRNVALEVPPFALAGSGVLTFVSANGVGYPAFGGFAVDAGQMANVLGKSDGRALPALVETLRPHTLPSLAGLFWDRFAATWHWYEIPNNTSFYYFRLRAPVLAWLPVTFFFVAPLGLVGLVLGLRRFAAAWPLYGVVVCFTLALVVFLVLGRLRAPLLAALIPFAALALVELRRWRRRVVAVAGVAVVLLAAWVGRPLPSQWSVIRLNDWVSPFQVEYRERVAQALSVKDTSAVANAYRDFLRRYEPAEEQLGANGMPGTPEDRQVAKTFGEIHALCARMLNTAGRAEEARAEADRANRWLQFAAR